MWAATGSQWRVSQSWATWAELWLVEDQTYWTVCRARWDAQRQEEGLSGVLGELGPGPSGAKPHGRVTDATCSVNVSWSLITIPRFSADLVSEVELSWILMYEWMYECVELQTKVRWKRLTKIKIWLLKTKVSMKIYTFLSLKTS